MLNDSCKPGRGDAPSQPRSQGLSSRSSTGAERDLGNEFGIKLNLRQFFLQALGLLPILTEQSGNSSSARDYFRSVHFSTVPTRVCVVFHIAGAVHSRGCQTCSSSSDKLS